MTQALRPTDVELKLLKILWATGPATVKEVHSVLSSRQDYSYTGTLRMLQVMFEKGLVLRDESNRSHVYRPAHPRVVIEKGLVADLRERLFGGSALALVQAALASGPVDETEKAAIRALLKQERP